jgi:formamidopyrimidine-DNA glycosylase
LSGGRRWTKMPELPEVETIRRELAPRLVGRTITRLSMGWEGCVDRPGVDTFCDQVVGRRIEEVGRRGKFLVLTLSGGKSLLVHLRMTGSLLVKDPGEPEDTHTRLVFYLDDGRELRFRNVRKFGRLYLVDDPNEVVGDLGPEPLEEQFSLADFRALFQNRRGMIKPRLLDQSFLAGLGNIYVDEALFRARIHPRRTAESLTMDELDRLYQAIREVLEEALAHQGTSRSDYVRPDGSEGTFQDRLLVSGKAGQPCPRCGAEIERLVVGGRGTYVCPRCQQPPAEQRG